MRTVLLVVGARPNFMKVAPVQRALERAAPELRLVLAHTGQHYDSQMSKVFFGELGMPEPDVFLGVGSGSHGEQTAKALTGLEKIIVDEQPELVVVAGDVNSTLAGALAAVKLHVPVAHIEAGLRSFDRSMPEEHNRRLTDALSAVLLTHSEEALDNLRNEGVDPTAVHLVGNTMIDSLLEHLPVALSRAHWSALGLEAGTYALVTLHRPALVDDPDLLRETIDGLDELARTIPVVFPVHPRTRSRIDQLGRRTADEARLLPRRAPRVPRFPRARGEGAIRPDRLRRCAGRDVGARRSMLHLARFDGTPDHRHARNQHAPGPQPGADRRDGRAGRRCHTDVTNSALGRTGRRTVGCRPRRLPESLTHAGPLRRRTPRRPALAGRLRSFVPWLLGACDALPSSRRGADAVGA